MKVVVIDGQGGNLGKQIVKSIRDEFPDVYIRAIGTNSTATANMLKGGADEAATGENAVIVGARCADIIVGPTGIVVPDALLGEVSTSMAKAVANADVKKILIPMNKCDLLFAGTSELSTNELLEDALQLIRQSIK